MTALPNALAVISFGSILKGTRGHIVAWSSHTTLHFSRCACCMQLASAASSLAARRLLARTLGPRTLLLRDKLSFLVGTTLTWCVRA